MKARWYVRQDGTQNSLGEKGYEKILQQYCEFEGWIDVETVYESEEAKSHENK